MTVIIEELDTEIAPPSPEPRTERTREVKPQDDRKLMAAVEYEEWLRARLIAD